MKCGIIINRKFNDQFFMIKPQVLIKDHMPFDPIWECLHYPVDNLDFGNGKTKPSSETPYFDYSDSISTYQSLEAKDQCRAALRRMQAAGGLNSQMMEWSNYLRDCIQFGERNDAATVKNKYVKLFNDAVSNYNNCIFAFNQYADYWNRGFQPLKPEPVIVGMLQMCYNYLDSCKRSLAQVVSGDPDMKQSADQLQLAIDKAKENLDSQKVFLKIYFNTDPPSRPQLFKKYNGAGFPSGKK